MIYYEIEEKFRIQKKDAMSLIKRNPDIIYEMEVSYSALNDILTSRIVIVPLTIEIIKKSLDFSKSIDYYFLMRLMLPLAKSLKL
ncbi:MAG: hypothetical protein ABFD15_03425 [Methanofastidiosum sp.]